MSVSPYNVAKELNTTERKEPLDVILSYLPPRVRAPLTRSRSVYEHTVQEITLRAGRPVCIYCTDKRYCLSATGCLISGDMPDDAVIVSAAELSEVLMSLCDYSVYAHQDELTQGYLTVSCGVRVGVCGTAVKKDGRVTAVKHISTLSFRVPREVIGCSAQLLGLIEPIRGVLICGAPCSGKTTLVRDTARALSYIYRVSIIDERGELAASSSSLCGYDMGLCDVYADMPKRDGVMCAVRSMSPDIIVCDELGDADDAAAVGYALRCGASFIATVHASSIEDLRKRRITRELLSTGAFGYIVFLSDRRHSGRVSRVYEWSGVDA